MDQATFETMNQLNLHCFRTTKNRSLDRKKAYSLYHDKVNMDDFAVHHTFRGLVGLVPRKLHIAVHHVGYFWRLVN